MPLPDFAVVFEHLPDPFMLLDRDLKYVAANAAYLSTTSKSFDDLRGRHVLDVFPHDPSDPDNVNAQLLLASLERVRDTGVPDTLAHIPYRVPRTPDGPLEERVWSASHTPIVGDDGRTAFILQHTVDVTELHALRNARASDDEQRDRMEAGVLRRAEDVQAVNFALDAERRHLRHLFQQAPGFICVLRGPDHIVELANAAYYRLVGDRPSEGRPIRETVPEVVEQGFITLLDQVLQTGQPFIGRNVAASIRRPGADEAEDVFVDFVYQPIVDSDGKAWGVFVQGHDITNQKRLEAELEQLLARERAARADAESARAQADRANLLKDEFLATLSHELRTPLNALLGWARLLRERDLGVDGSRKAVETIERNAVTLAQLVEDVLDMSRIVTGKLRLRLAPCDLADVVGRALDIVMPAAEARRVLLRADALPPAVIMGDADRLQQVVWNLLTNAVKYTPEGGEVTVSIEASLEVVDLVVRDNGIGIDPEHLPIVFDRFRQVDPAVDRRHGGLGVGLALVRSLVEAHGGLVSAFSEGRGRGATFTVRLPTRAVIDAVEAGDASARPRAEVAVQPPHAAVDGLRVLVVEDNPDALELVSHVLKTAGADVAVARTALEALDQIWMTPPDVVVSDLGLPGMDGLELLRHVRAQAPRSGSDVPAIALTAYARPTDREHALRAGFQAHLAKPVHPERLLAAIAEVTRGRPVDR